jgi:hypothetical protein
VRINAQLIDATTSGHVWAERYDGSLADVFALQDRVTGRIVDALAVSLTAREQRARERAETAVPEAYDAFLKGWEHAQTRTPEQYVKALEYFQRAVELDPDYARAHAAIASVYWKSWWEGWYATLGVHTSGRGMPPQTISDGQWPNRRRSRIRSPPRCNCGEGVRMTRLSRPSTPSTLVRTMPTVGPCSPKS